MGAFTEHRGPVTRTGWLVAFDSMGEISWSLRQRLSGSFCKLKIFTAVNKGNLPSGRYGSAPEHLAAELSADTYASTTSDPQNAVSWVREK